MKVIGITGSSGAGKSTLSKILSQREDVALIDADKMARKLSVPGAQYLLAIKEKFGDEILLEDGSLNRKLLASKIYNNEDNRKKLNDLTFDYVFKAICEEVENLRNSTSKKIAVIDAPLLFESGLDNICDYVVSLIADRDLKIERICKRDNIDKKTAESRLNIQQSDEYYISKSDFVIYNKKNFNLENEIDKIINLIKEDKK